MISRSKSKVYFFFPFSSFNLRNRTLLKNFIEGIFTKEKRRLNRINYIFTSDSHLLKMNQKYLSHDYYTDILSFDLSDDKEEVAAEVYISIDQVKENAKKNNVSFENELYRVIFHGALHLCGYNDKSSREAFQMRKREDYYLNSLFAS